jgi:hypothetical protein
VPVAGPRLVYYNIRNPPPSAVRCAQVSGYEPRSQKSVKRKSKAKQASEQPRTPHSLPLRAEYRKLTLATEGYPIHLLPCNPLIHPPCIGPILVRPIGCHAIVPGTLQGAFPTWGSLVTLSHLRGSSVPTPPFWPFVVLDSGSGAGRVIGSCGWSTGRTSTCPPLFGEPA